MRQRRRAKSSEAKASQTKSSQVGAVCGTGGVGSGAGTHGGWCVRPCVIVIMHVGDSVEAHEEMSDAEDVVAEADEGRRL